MNHMQHLNHLLATTENYNIRLCGLEKQSLAGELWALMPEVGSLREVTKGAQ